MMIFRAMFVAAGLLLAFGCGCYISEAQGLLGHARWEQYWLARICAAIAVAFGVLSLLLT